MERECNTLGKTFVIVQETYMEEMSRLQRQFLIHSFLYYELSDSVIPDSRYDKICKDMVSMMRTRPKAAKESPYYELCIVCDASGSGYYIDKYPPEIITSALRHLYRHREPIEDFGEYIKRFGFHIIERGD